MTLAGPILCVTPNPAIDRTARVDHLCFGVPMRPTEVLALPGGKGLNAARAAMRLGATIVTTGLAGGHAGGWLVEALEREGLGPRFAAAAAETRTTYVTVDGNGRSVIVYEPSAPVSTSEWDGLLRLMADELLPRVSWVVVAGSFPVGAGPEAAGAMVHACREAGRPVLVDTAGPHLLAALEAGPDVVKVGRDEVVGSGIVGARVSAARAAHALARLGARLGVVTNGGREAAASDGSTTWSMRVPRVEVVNTVGSGDAFNAGLVTALAAGASVDAALARGVAAGSANAQALAAGMLDPARVAELKERVAVQVLAPRL